MCAIIDTEESAIAYESQTSSDQKFETVLDLFFTNIFFSLFSLPWSDKRFKLVCDLFLHNFSYRELFGGN